MPLSAKVLKSAVQPFAPNLLTQQTVNDLLSCQTEKKESLDQGESPAYKYDTKLMICSALYQLSIQQAASRFIVK